MATAGSIVLDLLMRTGSFFTDSKRAESQLRQLEKAAKNFGRSVGTGMAQSAAGFAAAFLSIQAGAQFIGNAIQQADRLDELSAKLQISTEVLSGWSYAAKMSGTDLETLDKSLAKLSKTMSSALDPKSSAAGVFKALGVDVVDASGRLRDVEAVLPDLADKFAAIENQTLKSAVAMEVFGKSGSELLEFLSRGSVGINQLVKEAEDLQIIIPPEQAEAAARFNDKLESLKGAMTGLATRVSAELLPNLEKLVEKMLAFVRDGDRVAEVSRTIGNAFDFVSGTASTLGSALDFVGNKIEGITETLYGLNIAARGVFSQDWEKFAAGLGVAGEGVKLQLFGPPKKSDPLAVGPAINFAGKGAEPANFFAMSQKEADARAQVERLEMSLQAALSSKAAGGSGKAGKSDAEKQAERVTKALREMVDAQSAWQDELSGSGNPIIDAFNKRLDELADKSERFKEIGVPADKIQAFNEQMTKLAESIKAKELVEFQEEFDRQTKMMAAAVDSNISPALLRYQEDLAELDRQLKGMGISQEKYAERVAALGLIRHAEALNLRSDIEFEIHLLGKAREEQELLNEARRLGADAATAEGQAALDALRRMQDYRRNIETSVEVWDAARQSTLGFFDDLKEGISVIDSLTNALDNFADELFNTFARNITQGIFGPEGSVGGGLLGKWLGGSGDGAGPSGGGWLSSIGSIIGGLFGGARAQGGDVISGRAYLIGERGPEMFVPRTAGAIIPTEMTRDALQGGNRGTVVFNNSQHYNGLPGRQTMKQSQTDLGLQIRRQVARNR